MTEKIPSLFVYTGCRLYQDVLKTRFEKVLPLYMPEGPYTSGLDKFLLFFEYVGNNTQTLDTISNLLSNFSNSEVMIIIDDCYEGLIDNEFLSKFQELLSMHSIVKDYCLLSSNLNLGKKCLQILGSDKNFIYFNVHLYLSAYDNIAPEYLESKINNNLREKKFLCVNRQERGHRLKTIDFLIKKDILKNCFASCMLGDYAGVLDQTDFKAQNAQVEKYQDPDLIDLELTQESKDRLSRYLPLELDVKDYQRKVYSTEMPSLEKYFSESYWSIITEGDFSNKDNKQQFTEKVLKAFAYHHPFIVIGLPGTLDLLKKHGFITFSSVIDESYDQEQDDKKRLEMALQEIDKLNKLNMHELKDLYDRLLPILDHNFKTYKQIFAMNQPTELVNRIMNWYYD